MKVCVKKTEEEIRRELFGPIREAATTSFNLGIDPRESWCELSEMRLMQLIIDFKPAGVQKYFNLAAIVERMAFIFDDDPSHCEIYLNERDRVKFRQQQRELCSSLHPENVKRLKFPTNFATRPSPKEIERKVQELYDMKVVEKNEGLPDNFDMPSEFFLPDGEFSELMRKKEERSVSVTSSTTTTTSKRRKLGTPSDD
ncbi:unnamed protein product [Caenorhabditis bovis]|uniref:Uncharacterized protein n=1 Tax=Caenorhabditis bovis TaxID=2654633 RepID=A0A8S1EYA3_9PELO|nr:unnamed protein product [Caenorhabditis bovis]